MHPRRRRMLVGIVLIVLGMGTATGLALRAFQENLLYFYSPSQIAAGEAPAARAFRVGGLVVDGSVSRDPQSLAVSFVLTDTLNEVRVFYDGILPDLFREGQGIVANGRLREDGAFAAAEVLARHDETYMPPEVADALTRAGAQMPHAYTPDSP
jgi:cytochrome c-type biogenesis protein CcmE